MMDFFVPVCQDEEQFRGDMSEYDKCQRLCQFVKYNWACAGV